MSKDKKTKENIRKKRKKDSSFSCQVDSANWLFFKDSAEKA